MAIIFDIYIECITPGEREAIRSHFEGLSFELQTGKITHWHYAPEESQGMYGCSLWSPELSRAAVRTLADAIECTEAGIRLYQHLHQGPDFYFARVAWEATLIEASYLEDFMKWEESSGDCRLTIECVFTEALYEQLGKPKYCKAFRPGYVWTGYRGEEYHPLGSNDQTQLNHLYRDYFGYPKDL